MTYSLSFQQVFFQYEANIKDQCQKARVLSKSTFKINKSSGSLDVPKLKF